MSYADEKILKNAVQCLKCLDIIESTHVHDFKWCKCKGIAVDGGKEYLKRVGNIHGGYKDLSIVENRRKPRGQAKR